MRKSASLDAEIAEAAEQLWKYHGIYNSLARADAIVGLGSYDLRVVDRCVELYRQQLAPVVVFSGASGNWTRGRFDGTEAEVFAARAVALGVPASAIRREELATNIGENVRNVAQMLGEAASAILVTKPQTQRRVLATASKQWPKGRTTVTAPVHDIAAQATGTHTMRDLICEMVGDLSRIKDYPALGFQDEQPIPPAVESAYQVLVSAGFTEHLPKVQ